MQTKIYKLRRIIQQNQELSIYNESVTDNMSESEFILLIEKIVMEFKDFSEKPGRQEFIAELHQLRNIFDSENPYPQSKM